MYMIIYKQAYVTSLTTKLANMNWLLKFISILPQFDLKTDTSILGKISTLNPSHKKI